MPAAGVVLILAVVLIVAALVVLPASDDRRADADHAGSRSRRSAAWES